ncbi:membrane protein [Mycolicibacterium duvalii]|uniref:Membrane protein n=2 Tax=Mycolicibacterium duvalii TaxID=39688 RepID=A0A7I7K8X2_9MYCO|nr:membrane protein [Mycolicibacterium duvalii]
MAVQGAAVLVATALTLTGILGFVPGVTANLGEISWAGPQSGAALFGSVTVSVAANALHILVGLCGFALARTYAAARAYLLGGGLIYFALGCYGFAVDYGRHVLPLNSAANWLHVVAGAVMVLLAVTLAGQHDPTRRRHLRVRRAAAR